MKNIFFRYNFMLYSYILLFILIFILVILGCLWSDCMHCGTVPDVSLSSEFPSLLIFVYVPLCSNMYPDVEPVDRIVLHFDRFK